MSENLKKELETYKSHREKLIAEAEGQYVVIHGEEVAGTWQSYEDALKAAYEKYGLKPFLVKRIEGIETVLHFTRNVAQCQS